MRFEDLRLIEPLLRAVRTEGYLHPTPVQLQAIPHVLAGRDVLGCAQTGTGKTAAFALPILQRLIESPRRTEAANRIRVLVLCPTRELAQQIHDSFGTYGRHTPVRPAVIFGGVSQGQQVRRIQAGVDVLIATPGRLLDLLGQGLVNLAGIETLVLDEADRMLDMGFLPDVRRIIAKVPRKRQTLLFSATMPDQIRKLAADILDNAAPVQVARVSSPAPTVNHWVCYVEKPEKPMLLTRWLEHTPHTRALVFTRTKHGADRLTRLLVQAGVRAAALHGNKSQGARVRALAEFRSAQTPVLVATDIAARGLDVEDISHVINYDLTCDPETYVHRIGRTGRAGATGTALSFCTSQDHEDLQAIERLLRTPLQRAADLPRNGSAIPAQTRDAAPPRIRDTAAPRTREAEPRRNGDAAPPRTRASAPPRNGEAVRPQNGDAAARHERRGSGSASGSPGRQRRAWSPRTSSRRRAHR